MILIENKIKKYDVIFIGVGEMTVNEAYQAYKNNSLKEF